MDPDPQIGPVDATDDHGPYRRPTQLLPPPDLPHPDLVPPNLPPIADYWPDRAVGYVTPPIPVTAPPAGARGAAIPPAPPRRSLRAGAVLFVASSLLLGAAGVVGFRIYRSAPVAAPAGTAPADPAPGGTAAAQPNATDAAASPAISLGGTVPGTSPDRAAPGTSPGGKPAGPAGGVATPAGGHAIWAPLGGRSAATFDLLTSTGSVSLRTTDLGDDLYQISTPAADATVPRAATDGDRIRLSLVRTGTEAGTAVNIRLNSRVRWDLRFTGGAKQSVIDLSGSRLGRVDLAGGATRVELRLPRPDGTLRVRMTGGVNQFLVHVADGVPVRVRAGEGAGRVVLDGRRDDGVARGARFTSPGWDDAKERIDLDAVAGMRTLTVDRR